MKDTIVVFGSSRRNGNTGKLVDWIAQKLDVTIIDLSEKEISPYDYDHKNMNDDFISTMDTVLAHKKIIFASPVYWYSMSAHMKIFIDRISDFLSVEELKDKGRALRGKVGYVVCTSISPEADASFVNAFKDTFGYLGMKYGGHIHADCGEGYIESQYMNDVENFIQLVTSH